LAGDRNITGDGLVTSSIMRLSPSSRSEWTSASHVFKGNLLYADGHVGQENNEGLASAVNSSGTQISQLLPPVVPPASGEITVTEEPMVVASLQRFFDSGLGPQNGGAANPTAEPQPVVANTPAIRPNSPQTPVAQPVARPPADVPKPVPPAPAVAARPGPKVDDLMATNPALAVAAQNKAAVGHTGAPAKVPSGAPGSKVSEPDQFNLYFLLFQPGSHFWSWLLLLLLAVSAAFLLGWHLYRSRAGRRLAAAGSPPRGA
jgi:prepilin-type processing-associated H-X9-DG protein